tara:strand:- start:2059 stop:3585 length:1527 start_codon:yes stop_codon:yes gene_type:complete
MINFTDGFIEGHVCGFNYSLWRYLKEADIANMNAYASTVESALETLPSDLQINVPIVFHTISDNSEMITSDFNPNYLLTFINSYFAPTNIQFGLAKYSVNEVLLPTEGFNKIKGGTVPSSTRLGVTYTYPEHGVALNEYADKNNNIAVPGIPIEEIQSLPQIQTLFPSNKYLNIILINKINKIPDTEPLTNAMSSYSCNPYFADILGKPELLSPVIPFWAIGKSTDVYNEDPEIPTEIENSVNALKTNFGYSYKESPVKQDLLDSGVLNAGMASRGRTIAHAIAHSFGLSHTTNPIGVATVTCNDSLVELYKADIKRNISYRDFIIDTETIDYPSAGYSHLTEEELNSINSCSDNLVHSDVLNHMHLNQLLPGYNSELSELYGNSYDNYSFSSYQIQWMKANFYYFIEGNTPGLFEPNYLNQVASNYNVATGTPIIIEEDGDGGNQDGGEGNNADADDDDETSEVGPCDDGNRSLFTPKSNINLSSNSINFNSKLNSVQNILNNITND